LRFDYDNLINITSWESVLGGGTNQTLRRKIMKNSEIEDSEGLRVTRSTSTKLGIPPGLKPTSFWAPEGTYPGTIFSATIYQNSDGDDGLRTKFRLDPIPGEPAIYEVARTYWHSDMGLLLTQLMEVCGDSYPMLFDRVGQLDTTRLEGLRAMVTLTHYQGAGYSKPFVRIVALKPIGSPTRSAVDLDENGDIQQ
jgi:hypothetical protein